MMKTQRLSVSLLPHLAFCIPFQTPSLLALVTETASEILGKYRQKKKLRVTAEFFYLCYKRRELRKKRFEPEDSEKYKEVNNNIKRCM